MKIKSSREFRKMVKGIVCFAILPAVVIVPLISTAFAADLKLQLQGAWDQGRNSVTLSVNPGEYTKAEVKQAFICANGVQPLSVITDKAVTKYVITFDEGERFTVFLNGRNPIAGRNEE